MSAIKRPAAFSVRPVYTCPICGDLYPVGGWQREHDYQDHVAAHARWAAVRAEVLAWAALPVLALLGLWVALTSPRRHDHTGALAALLLAVCAVVAILCSPWGR